MANDLLEEILPEILVDLSKQNTGLDNVLSYDPASFGEGAFDDADSGDGGGEGETQESFTESGEEFDRLTPAEVAAAQQKAIDDNLRVTLEEAQDAYNTGEATPEASDLLNRTRAQAHKQYTIDMGMESEDGLAYMQDKTNTEISLRAWEQDMDRVGGYGVTSDDTGLLYRGHVVPEAVSTAPGGGGGSSSTAAQDAADVLADNADFDMPVQDATDAIIAAEAAAGGGTTGESTTGDTGAEIGDTGAEIGDAGYNEDGTYTDGDGVIWKNTGIHPQSGAVIWQAQNPTDGLITTHTDQTGDYTAVEDGGNGVRIVVPVGSDPASGGSTVDTGEDTTGTTDPVDPIDLPGDGDVLVGLPGTGEVPGTGEDGALIGEDGALIGAGPGGGTGEVPGLIDAPDTTMPVEGIGDAPDGTIGGGGSETNVRNDPVDPIERPIMDDFPEPGGTGTGPGTDPGEGEGDGGTGTGVGVGLLAQVRPRGRVTDILEPGKRASRLIDVGLLRLNRYRRRTRG